MYEAHFGLRFRPFGATPDSPCYYPATNSEQALAHLFQAISEDEGLTLLTGGPGMGKTLLCHQLLERLGPDVSSAFLTNSHIPNRLGFLQAVLYDLSIPYEGLAEQELRLKLTDYVLKNYGGGTRTLLVIDEAQHLNPDLLEELRLWGNLEARHGKALQVVLVGQPEIVATLQRSELAVLSQRLVVRLSLDSLNVHEAVDYLLHHIRAAGGKPEVIFSEEAIEVLARGTHGVPRLLNQAAHQALVLAFGAEATTVDAEAALEALTILGLEPNENNDDLEASQLISEPLESMGEGQSTEEHELTDLLDDVGDVPQGTKDAESSPKPLFGKSRRSA